MINNPIPQDLASECRKCARIVSKFVKAGIPGRGAPTDQFIPNDILARAKGIAILTVLKAGFIWGGRAGSGLVVARLPDGSWSAPSAIATAGMSVGGQIGAEVTDFVIVLNTDSAVKAFSKGGNVSLGGNLSVAAGPWGRSGEVSGTVRNLAPIYSYSKSKGLFAGISLEGTVILERKEANHKFYRKTVTAKQLLRGEVPQPSEARELYNSLNIRAGGTVHNVETEPELSSSNQSVNNPSYKVPITYPMPQPSYSGGSSVASSQSTAQPPPYVPSPISQSGGLARSVSGSNGTAKRPPPPLPPKKLTTAVALYDFAGQQDGDLSFSKGDLITVTKKGDGSDEWWMGRLHGKEGMFPANYVELR
ncbi:hypothetical protein BKA69DRAFT_1126287 [Paraphysoderma sedebokerense]|nr:hypothetical protein BKA69DRAFT_1126287 [Paraphysoderma sedebokerense]